MKLYDTAIVGGGIAGYTAALTSKNLLLDYIWFGEEGFGDKLRLAEKITNFPTVTGDGADFAKRLNAQMGSEKIALTPKRIDGIYRTGDNFTLSHGGELYLARTVILATGVEAGGRIRGEKEFLGKGVSYCAVCDGALYRGKTVAAVVSSPKFEAEVQYLAQFAKNVFFIPLYRGSALSGGNIAAVEKRPIAVEGESRVERLVLEDGVLKTDGVFFLKNSVPPAALAFGLETEEGHVKVDRALKTNLAGLFAAGDVTGRPYQYAKAAGEGCVAAHSVRAYLREFLRK